MPPAPLFRFNARNAFLTYPHSGNITPLELGNYLEQIRPTRYVHITRELHADGSFHLHALIQWIEKFNTRNPRQFDYNNRHPNIVIPRDLSATVIYITKHITPENIATEQYISGALSQSAKSASSTLWKAARDATTEEECLQKCSEASARDYILNHDRIREFARTKAQALIEYKHPDHYTPFIVPNEIQNWLDTDFLQPVSPYTLPMHHFQNSYLPYHNRNDQDLSLSLDQAAPERPHGHALWGHTLTGTG